MNTPMSHSRPPSPGETSASHRLGGITMAVMGTSIYLLSMLISIRSARDTSWNLPLVGVFFLLLGAQQLYSASLLKRIERLERQLDALGAEAQPVSSTDNS